MKKFIPQNHKEIEGIVTLYMFLLAVVIILVLFLCWDWRIFLLLALLASPILYMGLLPLLRKFGLYIENDKIVFKRFLRKQLDIKDIKGLLILKSEYRTRYSYHFIKNRDKSFKYSIVYLKEVDPIFADFNLGDVRFMSCHKEDAYFYTVYDEEIIEFFKGKIPIMVCK